MRLGCRPTQPLIIERRRHAAEAAIIASSRPCRARGKNLRGVIKEMDRLYPGLGEHLEEETTAAIDGEIHETAYFQPIREGCEIFFIPKLEGANLGNEASGLPHRNGYSFGLNWGAAADDGGYSARRSSLAAQLADGIRVIHQKQQSADTRSRRS